MKKLFLALSAGLLVVSPAVAKQWKTVEPLAAEVVDNVHIVGVDIAATGAAVDMIAHFDAKAAEKKKVAGATSAATPETAAPIDKSTYASLPFSEMAPLVFADVTSAWGLNKGRAVKLKIVVDTLKTANAGMAMLMSSADQLAGMVEVQDAETGTALGSFYVDVRNAHSGWLGMAMRGSGIREKLVEEFALESSRALTGRKSKTKRA